MGGFETTVPNPTTRRPPTPRAPGMPMALADTHQRAGVDIDDPRAFQEDRQLLESIVGWAKENPYDAAAVATAPIPGVGDAVGFANDLRTFATDPESRTPVNVGLSALGALPFVPSGLGVFKDVAPAMHTRVSDASDVNIYHNPTRAEAAKVLREPEGGGAAALLGEQGNWFLWRRDAAPFHHEMLDLLEERGHYTYSSRTMRAEITTLQHLQDLGVFRRP
jgi:hypothetical protein